MAWLGIYQNAEVNIFFLSITYFLSKFSVYLFSSVSENRHWRKRRNVVHNYKNET